MSNVVLVFTIVFGYGITAWVLLMISVYIVNRFWIDPLQKQNNNSNNKNHITAEPITAEPITVKQNYYKEAV